MASVERERLHRGDLRLVERGVEPPGASRIVAGSRTAGAVTPPLPLPPEIKLPPPTSWLRRRSR